MKLRNLSDEEVSMKLRNLSDEEVIQNMLELTLFLAFKNDGCNDIKLEINGVHMHFECYWSEGVEDDL